MRIASVLAGFTLGQSDVLRKAMGKKDPKVMAKQREAFLDGAQREGHQREEGHQDLRPDGVLRRLRLQQVALDGLRLPGLPDRLPQGQLPAALRRGAADHRGRQHRQARALHRRVPRPRHRRAAARHQREPAALHGRARRRALRPDRHQGPGRGRHPGDPRGARTRLGRITSLHQLCEELDLRLVNKRVLEALVKSGACDALAQPPARRRCRRRRPRPAAARHRRAPSSTAAACSATASRARPICSATAPRRRGEPPPASPARRRRRGPRWSCWPTRRRRSAST